MKKSIIFGIAAVAALPFFFSCQQKEEEQVVVRAVAVSPATLNLEAGDTEVLTAEITPSNATDKSVTWSSSAETVATVSQDGVVTAVGSGKAVITAKSGSKSGSCEVTVMGGATGVTVSPSSVELSYNESATVVAVVEPAGFVKNTAVTWTSSDPDLVKVESDGLSARITAASTKGSYTVKVKTADGGFEAECAVSVVGLSSAGLKTASELVSFLEKAEEFGADEDVKLAADIDMTGVTVPSATSYKGTFNGQGFSILNATLTAPLFLINEGTVKNVVIAANCKVQPLSAEFAPLVGINKGTVSGCTNNALISYDAIEEEYHLFGGLVEVNTRDGIIENCTNNGEIRVTVNEGVKSDAPTVGGIVGASSGFIRSCTNTGAIAQNPGIGVLKKGGSIGELIGGKNNIPDHAGGIVGWFVAYDAESGIGLTDRGIESCKNTAAVTVIALGGQETATCRVYIAGIAGAVSGGYLKDCTNEGEILLDHSSGKNAANTTDKQMWAGGVYNINVNDHVPSGGYTYPAVTKAVNRGNVTMKTDYSGAYMYVGGVCGSTDLENNAASVNPELKECVNYGKVLGTGYGKIRAGGITAQTGKLTGCINYGDVEIGPNCLANANAGSFAGNLSCYHAGAGHSIVDCEAYGNIKLGASGQMAGGFVGILGGGLGATPINGKVNCTVTGPEGSYCGILTGYCNASDQWIAGSAEAPMYVAGKLVVGSAETVLTEENYLNGWGQTYNQLVAWDKSGAHESTYIKFLK